MHGIPPSLASIPGIADVLARLGPDGIADLGSLEGLMTTAGFATSLSGDMGQYSSDLVQTGNGTYLVSIGGTSLADGNDDWLVATDWTVYIDQDGNARFQALAPLSCAERGCEAMTEMQLKVSDMLQLDTCALTVMVNMTDFDNDESSEQIEYISASGRVLVSNSTLGSRNPCKELTSGRPMSPEEILMIAVSSDVSAEAAGGLLAVKAKVSQYVDECPSNGYMLDASSQVDCTATILNATSGASLLQSSPTQPAIAALRRLRGLRAHGH